ncbi:hypothetical protein [Rheinheimera salexigens]|uniref:Uncharacterized protein n=1 Tax=Rheinheimera salexigens TaxID=1628148 RepID=A0A1E7Q8M5_9GAMM|nr:hypothetical protein [Rheinheimera salexigens]OEY70480.1 hypothetical protein BI198_13565 [Rheinheimera salexigens]
MNESKSMFIERIARYALGENTDYDLNIKRSMGRLGLCTETQSIMGITNIILKEDINMAIDPGLLAELVRLVKDVIEKGRRDRLIELVNDFFTRYNFVLRSWTRMEDRHKNCHKKDDEVNKHLQDAKSAAKAGDANAMQEAIAKAKDDLEELAECLGIEIMP